MDDTKLLPTLDLAEWHRADPTERRRIASDLDAGLRRIGMFQLRGHDVTADLRQRLRDAARTFFYLPTEQKERYRVQGSYGNGWRGPDLIYTSLLQGEQTPPDLHETFIAGPPSGIGDPQFDAVYYPPNRWPDEVPELERASREFSGTMVQTAQTVLRTLAEVLGLAPETFTARTQHPTWTQSLNWYPSLRRVGGVRPGQLRVGPHSDFGTVSILDRQPGVGGLEIWDPASGWTTPPYDPDALTIILGDLMNLWTDGRWNAVRHRVQAPSQSAPDEELISLVFFFEADPKARIAPLPPPAGGGEGRAPVVAGEYILEKAGIINA